MIREITHKEQMFLYQKLWKAEEEIQTKPIESLEYILALNTQSNINFFLDNSVVVG
jgi:hypothetical protein